MNRDFKLKRFHKFGILTYKTRILRPNLDWDINFEPFYIIYAKRIGIYYYVSYIFL